MSNQKPIKIRTDNPFICELSCQCGMRWKFDGPEGCVFKLRWFEDGSNIFYSLQDLLTKLSIGQFYIGGTEEIKGHDHHMMLERQMNRVFRGMQ
jgi:hypothetical protein